ncbi:MAG: DUF6324 family protein [Paracoccaceae bacterium]
MAAPPGVAPPPRLRRKAVDGPRTGLSAARARAYDTGPNIERSRSVRTFMGIDSESDLSATLRIGPTSEGQVRLFVEADGGVEVPMDFDPEEAEEIAEELRAAAEAARRMPGDARHGSPGKGGGGAGRKSGPRR